MRGYGIAVLGLLAGALGLSSLAGCGRGAVAVVNGRKITEKEFHQRLETMHGHRTLYDMIAREILTQEAEAQGITVSPKLVDERVAEQERQFSSHEEFLRNLEVMRGQSVEQFRDEIAFLLMLEELGTKDVNVTEEDVRKYFADNREAFDRPELYRVAEILVGTEKEATELRAVLDDPQTSFGELAGERSKSPSASMGGVLQPRPLDGFPEQIQPQLQTLELGALCGPLEMEGGWRIFKLLGKDPRQPASLEDPAMRDRIYQTLRAQRSKDPRGLLDELTQQGKYRVTVGWPRYKQLQSEFEAARALPEFGAPGTAEPETQSEGQERPTAEPPADEKPKPTGPAAGARQGRQQETQSTDEQASKTNQ